MGKIPLEKNNKNTFTVFFYITFIGSEEINTLHVNITRLWTTEFLRQSTFFSIRSILKVLETLKITQHICLLITTQYTLYVACFFGLPW